MSRQLSALEVLGLNFGYQANAPLVLSEMNLALKAGTVTAITGPSGCGKSTLLYIMGLLLTPTRGEVRIGGTATTALSDANRSLLRGREVGFLFQDSLLDPSRTVVDNIREGLLLSGQSMKGSTALARELLEAVGLDGSLLFRRLPASISGGQAQRVALCRALIKRPSIILADEPTGNLDSDSASVVRRVLREAASTRGAAVCVATHDRDVVEWADDVVSAGSHSHLAQDNGR